MGKAWTGAEEPTFADDVENADREKTLADQVADLRAQVARLADRLGVLETKGGV